MYLCFILLFFLNIKNISVSNNVKLQVCNIIKIVVDFSNFFLFHFIFFIKYFSYLIYKSKNERKTFLFTLVKIHFILCNISKDYNPLCIYCIFYINCGILQSFQLCGIIQIFLHSYIYYYGCYNNNIHSNSEK